MAEETLRRSLASNGLSTEGTKAEMAQRLLTCEKPNLASTEKAPLSLPLNVTSKPSLEFVASERAAMQAAGIAVTDDFDDEIHRRWEVYQRFSKPASDTDTGKSTSSSTTNAQKLDFQLGEDELAKKNLFYVGETKDKKHMYVKKPRGKEAMADIASEEMDAIRILKRREAKRKAPSDAVMFDDMVLSRSMDFGENSMDGEDDDDYMSNACKITVMRLMKSAKKEHIIPLLQDFGVPTKGSKEELATLLSEQLHYDTDNDSE